MINNISNPWFTYPGSPINGYIRQHPQLKPELSRLMQSLINLRENTRSFLFHLTIGAAAEEIGITQLEQTDSMFQMHQLIPAHVLDAGNNGITIVEYVVCPNIIDVPLFMSTHEWRKMNNTEYKHNTLPITIYFFCTMMPTKDKKRNDLCMSQPIFTDITFIESVDGDIKQFMQTDNDRLFVDVFYNELKTTVSKIRHNGGATTCFSFAVFQSGTSNSKFNNCAMFKEVIDCFPDTSSSCIYEWVYRIGIFVVGRISRQYDNSTQRSNSNTVCFVPQDVIYNNNMDCNNMDGIFMMELAFTPLGKVIISYRDMNKKNNESKTQNYTSNKCQCKDTSKDSLIEYYNKYSQCCYQTNQKPDANSEIEIELLENRLRMLKKNILFQQWDKS